MAVRLTCTDNASGHDGLRWRMGPDSESVDVVVGETAPGVGELVVNDPITPEACFSVVAYAGSEESDAAEVCAEIIENEDFTNAQPGDYIGGGVYAGQITYADGRQFHIVAAKATSEREGLKWGYDGTVTGAADPDDGKANQELILQMVDDGVSYGSHPPEAFQYCDSYTAENFIDWYLPARNELQFITEALGVTGHAEFTESAANYRWSSTERDGIYAWNRQFSNSGESYNRKNGSYFGTGRTRPIRRVAV